MPMNYTFDATQHQPIQGVGEGHPKGKFPAAISNTSIEPTKDNSGGMFVVEFTTQAGSIKSRYNLWNNSPKAVEIAHKELSALCHATGVFKVAMENDGAALRGAQLMIEVDDQKDKEGKPNGYVEVKKVYDKNGNEPGKTPANQPQPQGNAGGWAPQPQNQSQPSQQQPPMQQSNTGGWNTQGPAPSQQQPPAQQQPSNWGNNAQNNSPAGGAPNNAAPPWAKQ